MEKAVKQAISLLLAAAMMISVLPVGAFAAEVDTGAVVQEGSAVVQEGSADVQEDTGSEKESDTGSENGSDTGNENGSDTGTETGAGGDTGSVDVSESVPEESNAESEEVKLPEDDQPAAPRMLSLRLATPDGPVQLTVSSDSLQAKIAEAADGSGTVTMEKDYTENVIFPMGKTVILDMAGHTLNPDTSTAGDSLVNTVTVFGTAVIKGGTISGKAEEGKTVNARGVLVPNGGKLILGEGAVVCGFTVQGSGGGIHVDGDGALELDGGTVKDNRAAETGGGIFIYDAEKLRVKSGTVISGNEAANGGGIAAYRLYTYGGYLSGLTLENNKAENGGGLYFGGIVDLPETMPFGGITFRNNQASQNGGGLYCRDKVRAVFTDMIWDGNTAAKNGGAAYFVGAATVDFQGGAVKNSRSNSGALYFAAASTVNFDGTILSGNQSTSHGGALYAVGALQMELNNVTISDNTAGLGGTGDTRGGAFYLSARKNQVTLLSGTISGNTAKPRQSEYSSAYGGALFIGGDSTFTMKGGIFDGNTVNGRGGGVHLSSNSTAVIEGGTFRNNKAGWGGGLYISGKLNISDVLAEKNTGTAIVADSGSMTISGGTFRENTSGNTSITAVTTWNGTLTVTGGTFTKNSGVAVGNSGGTVTISGGEIYENTGSGVGNRYGTVNIQEGANIHDNAQWGVYNSYEGSKVVMTGGKVYNNATGGIYDYGGGLYWNNPKPGRVTVSGGEITNNGGRGVYCGIAEISGGVISGNVGGVNATDATVSGGAITGNSGVDNGGGVYVSGGLKNGTAPDIAYYHSRLSVTGGVIRDNRANKLGNDLYVAKPTFDTYEEAPVSVTAAVNMTGEVDGAVWLDEMSGETLTGAFTRRHTEETGVEAYTFRSAANPVAQIGETTYPSLQAAFDAIHSGTAPDSPVLLLKDDTENVTIPAGISATLDLRGHLIFTNSGTILTVGQAPAEAEGEEAPAAPTPASLTVKDSVGGGNLTGATTGAVVVNAGSSFTMQDISIEKNYNTTTAGGGVILRSGSSMTLTSGTISGNRGVGGSGIYVEKDAELTIDGGAISGNRTVASADGATNSGAIKALGRVIMYGGEITGNEISRHWQHPAVYLSGDGAYFELKNGTISGNLRGYQTSQWYSYGPIGVVQGAQMVMNGGSIENHTNATDRTDGASAVRVYNSTSAQCTSFTMNGGVIQGNTGSSGAVYVNSSNGKFPTAFIMTGGTIIGNRNSGCEGGAVRATGYYGELRLAGGEITGNESKNAGGGVYIGSYSSSKVTIEGTLIYGNTSGDGLGNDVYFAGSAQVLALRNPADYGMDAYDCWHDDLGGGDYPQTDYDELCKALTWTKSGDHYTSKAMALTAAKSLLPIEVTEGKVAYYVPTLYDDSELPKEATPEDYVLFATLAEAMTALQNNTVPAGATIHLMADFAETVSVPAVNFTLNLNGHTLTTDKPNGTIFTLTSGADMTLTDTVGPEFHKNAEGTLTKVEAYETGRGFSVAKGASLTVAGGQLTGFTMANQLGPAIYCEGNLTITGGSVTDNAYTGKTDSGVIRVNNKDSVVSITGGTFTGNAGYIGGVVSIEAAKSMLVQGVAFENNQAAVNGGAIVVKSCPELTLQNVTFRGNKAGSYGGGLCTYDGYTHKLLLENCSFEENTATTGGGASLGRNTKVTISGGSFTKNQTTGSGGGLSSGGYSSNNAQLAAKDVTFTENHAGGDGGGIWARNLSLTNCTFTGNTSVSHGGAVRHAADWNRPEDVLRVDDCQFSDNKAGNETTKRSGGAIYSAGAGMGLKNTTFRNNQATDAGGAVYRSSNSTDCTSTVETCTFAENAATNGGALCVSTQADVKDSEFEKNRATYGGALYINAQTNVENAEFFDNRATYGGAICVWYAPADIRGCKLYKNEATNGGAVYQTTNNTSHYVTLYQDTEIYNNTAYYGGGCRVARISLNDNARIYNNTAKYYGGGVHGYTILRDFAEIDHNKAEMYDGGGVYGSSKLECGSIHDNTAARSGGGISTSGSVTINGGEIYSNTAKSDGGGVCTYSLTMNSGTIRDNTAGRYGGGVGNDGHLFNIGMYGGEIRDNYAGNSGGGVYAAANADWSTVAHQWLVGGRITGNTAARNGGGVVLGQHPNITTGETRIYGDIVITDNHAGNYGGGIYYCYASQQEQNFGLYTGDTNHLGKPALYGNTAALGQDYYIVANANPNICRATDMSIPNLHVQGWLDESNNTLIDTEIHGKNPKYYALTLAYTDELIVAAVGEKLFATVGEAVEDIQKNPTGNHEIVMVADSRENVTVPASVDVKLNLNGHTLHGFSTAVTLNGTLTLEDTVNTNYDNRELGYHIGAGPAGQGTITGSAATYGGGFVVRSGGELIINSGNLSECYARTGGAAIYVNGGKATMNGGKISGNLGYNGAIYVNQARSTFILNGGEICDNVNRSQNSYYELGSGTLFNNGGNLMILGGEIHNNLGRNVVYSTGKTTITGGSFTKNLAGDSTSNQWGSGVIRVNGGTTNIGGTGANPVVISGNTATGEAGAIYLESGVVYLSHAELKNNKATTYGGAIYQNGGNLVVTSGTEISGNTAGSKGGAIYQNGGTAQILAGTINNNRAPVGGGIAQKATGVACTVFDGAKLYENVSTVSNTGNDIYSKYEGTDSWDMVQNKSQMTLEAVNNMRLPQYNVWRDDAYSGDNYGESETLMKGMYLTGAINQSNNLQLTTYYYKVTTTLKPLANNRKVALLALAGKTDKESAFVSGQYTSPAASVTTEEKTAAQMGWQESNETYLDSSGHEQHYLIGTDGKLYEQNQMAQWTPGEDLSKDSTLVLSNDTVLYSVRAQFEADGEQEGTEVTESKQKVRAWMEVELDADSSQAAAVIPDGFTGYVLSETRDGEPVQIMRCYKEIEVGQNALIYTTLSVKVRSMQDGQTLKPRISMWVEGNASNEQNHPTIDCDRLTVSATGRYNVTLKQNSKLAYTGYFDTAAGKEASRPEGETPPNVVYGTMLGYGITVMMCNTDADGKTIPAGKGIKGLEIPADGLEMELHMKGGLYLDGAPQSVDETGSNLVTPIFWALKENEKSDYGRGDGQSSATFNMNWDDEDEQYICSNYAYNAAPFNTGNDSKSCYSGGGWTLTRIDKSAEETVLHLKVSGYAFDTSNDNPRQNSDGSNSEQFNNDYTKPFTAGYLQMIFPFPEHVMQTANGYLSVDMQAAISDVKITSASGKKPIAGTDLSTLKAYYGDQAQAHATSEIRFSDNRIASTNGLYVFNGSGNATTSTTTNYWLTGERGAIAGDRGDGTVPLGSQVYMGGQLFYSSEEIRTDEEMRGGQPNPYYIPEGEFNPQTDNKAEYFYATAINMLQKFDADAYTPLTSTEVVDQRIIGTYNQNNIYVTTSESATNWTNNTNLTTSMNLTVLYAAKPDGKNWTKVTTTAQDMLEDGQAERQSDGRILYKGQLYQPTQAVFSDGGVGEMDRYHEEQLLYFETLDDLHAYLGADAKCVAILYQARDCCIRNGRNIRFEHKMQVTDDFDYTGQTYCTTNESRVWTTYRPDYKQVRDKESTRKAFLYDFNWDNVPHAGVAKGMAAAPGDYQRNAEYSTGTYQPKKVTVKRHTLQTTGAGEVDENGNPILNKQWISVLREQELLQTAQHVSLGYVKTEYEYGCQKAGTHNGYYLGNTLLLYTLSAEIKINGADKVVGSNQDKVTYNLGNGERIVNFLAAPKLSAASGISNSLVHDGSQSAEISIDLTFPAGIAYREGSIAFDYTPEIVNGKPSDTYAEGELEWVIGSPQKNADGTTTLHLKTYVSDIKKNLPKIAFSGFIGSEGGNDVKTGTVLSTEASIYATYEEHNQLAAIANSDRFAITVINDSMVGVYQDALTVTDESGKSTYSLVTEVGEDFGFKLAYYNQDSNNESGITIADVLPHVGDGRGTDFTGGYRVKQIQLVFTGTGAQKTAQSYDENGQLYLIPDVKNPAGDNQAALFQASLEGQTALNKPEPVSDSENTRYTFTYDIPEDAVVRSSDQLGKLLYVSLPNVQGPANVQVNVLLSPTDAAEGLLVSGEETQKGGNRYFNDFSAKPTGSEEIMSSLDVDVTVVQRTITGYAFMDMNQDGKFTLGNTADSHLKNIKVQLYEAENGTFKRDAQGNRIAAKDVMDRPVDLAWTDENGRYTFDNIAPGSYIVVFSDPDNRYVWKTNQPAFSDLAVTIRPGEDSGYNTTASDVNRSTDRYGDSGLIEAYLAQAISMPQKGTMKTAKYTSANNNAGFFCIEAVLKANWTGMITEVPLGTVLTYQVRSDNGYSEDFTITQVKPYDPKNPNESISTVKLSQNLELDDDKVKLTVPEDKASDCVTASYTWESDSFYLPVNDNQGKPIKYTFEAALGGAFRGVGYDDVGYDDIVRAVKLNARDGKTAFEVNKHQRSHDLAVTKVDAKDMGKGLSKAQFQIGNGAPLKFFRISDGYYRVCCDNYDKSGESKVTVDDNGRLKLIGLPEGELTLTEVKAPKGYVRPDGSWTVKIDEGGVTPDSFEDNSVTEKLPAIAVSKSTSETTDAQGNPITTTSYEYFITNVQHKQIPITGADGIGGYLIVGLTFMTAGALLLLEYRRRKRANGAV
ncbi:MAG: right-handed parallel beta-helix repeat-containing protein [Candidatus Faecousia sp.]|nr:right-handed parallel beta-helix repeat-containing protein [Candidatus Faecousia sp.]